ncbi:hypothetical protein IW261DRAFT_1656433 [Armillaria novae-zelandiae]|uniref:Uncharacterized protein n=1 Tax=Armillaria novae-zelandiae TaxID=153914 RepID=A0AA39KCL6_9AGAR|nr:hypothetical protein IW261DRAFT_1430357 [Armillaria novae-zelandiae]KAK0458691.1 hypothetical protein IW261DRAFT_1656433 [Armillaria novae-zelandiae]
MYRHPATKGLKPFAYESTISLPAEPMSAAMIFVEIKTLRSRWQHMGAVHPLYPSENCAETTYRHPATRNSFPTLSTPEIALRQQIAVRGACLSYAVKIRNCAEMTYQCLGSEVLMIVVWKYVLLLLNHGTSISAADEDQAKYKLFGQLLTRKLEGISRKAILDQRCGDGNETQQLAKENFKCKALFEQTTRLIEGTPGYDDMVDFRVRSQHINRDETVDEDQCDARCVDGFVQGLAVAMDGRSRHGKFIVECDDGKKEFKVAAAHTYPIPEDTYTLIYYICKMLPNACVVGRSLPGGRFEKVSVVQTCDNNFRDITEERRYILI